MSCLFGLKMEVLPTNDGAIDTFMEGASVYTVYIGVIAPDGKRYVIRMTSHHDHATAYVCATRPHAVKMEHGMAEYACVRLFESLGESK